MGENMLFIIYGSEKKGSKRLLFLIRQSVRELKEEKP